jgi:hypothetical protein
MGTEFLDREGNRTSVTWSSNLLLRFHNKRVIMTPGAELKDNKIPGIILFVVLELVNNAQTIGCSLQRPRKA